MKGRGALAKKDNGGHTRTWAPKVHLQSSEKDEGNKSDGRVRWRAMKLDSRVR